MSEFESVDWHSLDSNDVIHWLLPHLLAQNKHGDTIDKMGDLANVKVRITVGEAEFDGVRAIRDLYASMSVSFDRAVDEAIEERFRDVDMTIEDILTDVFDAAKAKLRGE